MRGRRRAAISACALILLPGLGRASVSSCASAGPSIGAIAANAGSTPAHSCGAVDAAFQFGSGAVNVFTSPTNVAAPDANGINPTASGTAPIGNSINPISLLFAPNGSEVGWSTGTTHFAAFQDETIDYVVTPNHDLSLAPATGSWFLTGLGALALGNPNFNGSDVPANAAGINVVETFCPNATSLATCTTSGEVQVAFTTSGIARFAFCGTVAGCVANSAAGTVTFQGVSSLFIRDEVNLSAYQATGPGSYSVNLTSFTASFDQQAQSPEPATWWTVALGIAGLIVRLKRA